MAAKGILNFEWDKDAAADGYIVRRWNGDEFAEFVRVGNVNLNAIFIPDVVAGIENQFKVSYYKKQNNESFVYRETNYYSFVGRGESVTYKLPIPKLKSAVITGNSVRVEWEKTAEGVTYLVVRRTAKERWTRAGMTKETYFLDKNIVLKKKYIYSVRCVSEDGTVKLSGFYLRGISV